MTDNKKAVVRPFACRVLIYDSLISRCHFFPPLSVRPKVFDMWLVGQQNHGPRIAEGGNSGTTRGKIHQVSEEPVGGSSTSAHKFLLDGV